MLLSAASRFSKPRGGRASTTTGCPPAEKGLLLSVVEKRILRRGFIGNIKGKEVASDRLPMRY